MRCPLLLCFFLATSLVGQEPPDGEPSAPDVFTETVDVLVVNIETVVTDKKGDRVTGLRREDFRLVVDGEEVPIDYFTEVRDGLAQPSTPIDVSVETPDELFAGEPIPTNYLVFIDDFFSIGAHRNVVLTGLADQLTRLGETDQVAVVAYDGRRATMLVGWTSDAKKIRAALEEARERRAGGIQRRMEANMFLSRPGSDIDAEVGTRGVTEMAVSPDAPSPFSPDAYYPMLGRQIDRLVEAAAATLRGSLPPPGRKVALLVAGGWTSGPLFEQSQQAVLAGVVGQEMLERQQDLLKAGVWYRPLVDTANLLGFTLYPIDAPGAGWSGPDVGSVLAGQGFGDSEANVEFTLKQLAAETGGRPLLNGLRSTALAKTVEDTRSYYWLGFSASRDGSGRHHDVRVEVVRPDLSARSRRSFVDMSLQEEAIRTVEAGLMLGEGEDMGDLDVTFGRIRPGEERRTVEAMLEIRVPFADLELLPVGGRLVTVFEVSLGARDKRDVVSNIVTLPVQMDLPEPPPPDAFARLPIPVVVRKEKHDFVVTVRDSVGGDVFIRRLTFDPKELMKAPARAADL